MTKLYIPHLKDEVNEYLKSDIHLKIGSLLKIIQKSRIDFIDKIRPTLEELVLDNHQGILFIKEFIINSIYKAKSQSYKT